MTVTGASGGRSWNVDRSFGHGEVKGEALFPTTFLVPGRLRSVKAFRNMASWRRRWKRPVGERCPIFCEVVKVNV